MKKFLSHLLCIALVILCSALMPIMLFFANVGAVKFYEIAVFIGIYSFIALAVFVVLRLLMKSEYKAAVATGFFILIFQNAGRLTKLMSYKFVLLIFVFVIAALIFAIGKFLKDEIAKLFVPVLSVVITMLLIMNTVMSIGKIVSVANVDSESQTDINKQYEYITSFKNESKVPDKLPNVYFLVVDEYAGFDFLEKYYDYDNTEFEEFLKQNKFNISRTSTNFTNKTNSALANLFNLEYSSKNNYGVTSGTYCTKKVANACLFQLAENLGYSVNVAQSSQLVNYPSKTEPYGDKWSVTADGDTCIDLLTTPSMLSPFVDKVRALLNGFPLDYFQGNGRFTIHANALSSSLSYFSNSKNVGKDNTFNLCYAATPHTPFLFDQNGNVATDTSILNNWGNKDFYLNQLKYCNTLLKATIENIIENDPDSIIILMSDHGVRNHSSEDASATWMKKITLQEEANILCAVYYKGEEFVDIEGMCGSNVLISVINEAWGYDIPLITQSDDMYYATP